MSRATTIGTWMIAAVLAIGTGCSDSAQQKAKPKMSPKSAGVTEDDLSRCNAAGKRVVKLDLNRDEQPDVWKLYASKADGQAKVEMLTCKEIDLNYDGRKDMWIYYDDEGNRKMEEMDLDFDGRVDIVTFRRGGKVIRQELDTNYDGNPDIWKYYEEEALVRVDRDSNLDSKVDFWEYYEGGQLDRVGYDKDGDGKVDQWDRAPSQPAPAAPPPPPEGEEAATEPDKTEG